LLLGLICLCQLKFGLAGTSISGNITNPVWTQDGSPYIIDGTVTVAKGALLRIEAGSEVRFNPGAKLLVNGELDVVGRLRLAQ